MIGGEVMADSGRGQRNGSVRNDSGDVLISCENLSFAYDGEVVLRGVNFSIRKGDYICIVGENGAGKSTLVRVLLGLNRPSVGTLVRGDLRSIGYLPQKTGIQKEFPASVEEVVLSGCVRKYLFFGREARESARKHMEMLGVDSLRRSCFGELSGGQQQRVLLARALCATDELLLLDEPAAGLDPLVTQELYTLISKINRERRIAVVMVSHDIHSALKFSRKILHLKQEQLFFGDTADYKETPIGEDFMCRGCR